MHYFHRGLSLLIGLAFICLPGFAQSTGPELAVSPGLLFTAASKTNNVLAGNPDAQTTVPTPSLNGVAFYNSPTQGQVVFISNAATHQVFKETLADGQVSLYAGNGTSGYSGDGGPAKTAQLNEPSGLAVDASGNLYIVDTSQNVVRKVDTSGNITSIAGNGIGGNQPFSGDNGPATSAQLNQPVGIAVDASNKVFIADTNHNRIRVVINGVINTVAGNGSASYSADGPATSTSLHLPIGVAVDTAGNVYMTDSLNHLVRELTGGNIVTLAGAPVTAGYSGDGGAATSSQLNTPYGIGVDAGGAIYIADNRNQVIRKIDTGSPRVITTVAGNNTAGYVGDGGSALTSSFNGPTGLSVDQNTGSVYVVDFGNIAVRTLSSRPAAVTFQATNVGSTASATITLANTGAQTLLVSNSTFTSGFMMTGGTCGSATPMINAGQSCTMTIQFAPQTNGPTAGTLTIQSNSISGAATVALNESNGLRFVPVSPCRVVDTRLSGGTFGTNEQRDYDIRHSTAVGCSSQPVPDSADVRAYSLNITVVPKGQLIYLTAFPTGSGSVPNVSNLNSYDGRVKANAAIVPTSLNDTARRLSIFARNPTDVVVDINGYYVPDNTALAFYPVPPCRAVDTRRPTTSDGLGGPSIVAKASGRSFDMVSSACGLPSSAQAYSLNITAVPRTGFLDFLTMWPSGPSRPVVSTLNSGTGVVAANAAIIPAGTGGQISAYSTDTIDLIIDVNGYYAPPQNGGLSLYTLLSPCRAYDSRGPNLTDPTTLIAVTSQDIAGSSCAPSRAAQSYLLNTTVIPQAPLIYMTNWANGTAQPLQSTLNAYDASVTSNLAVVPTLDGKVATYTTTQTKLILDIFGYFAQ